MPLTESEIERLARKAMRTVDRWARMRVNGRCNGGRDAVEIVTGFEIGSPEYRAVRMAWLAKVRRRQARRSPVPEHFAPAIERAEAASVGAASEAPARSFLGTVLE